MNISLEQIRPNLVVVTVGGKELAFSYQTVVAFSDGAGWVKSENIWSVTTGRHLNALPGRERIPHDEFTRQLRASFGEER